MNGVPPALSSLPHGSYEQYRSALPAALFALLPADFDGNSDVAVDVLPMGINLDSNDPCERAPALGFALIATATEHIERDRVGG
jgi:hypothetical protein